MQISKKIILPMLALLLVAGITAAGAYHFGYINVEANSPEQVFIEESEHFYLNLPPGELTQREFTIINNHPTREYTVSMEWEETLNEGNVSYWTNIFDGNNLRVPPGRTKVYVQFYVNEDSPPGYFDGKIVLSRIQLSD